MPVPELNDFNDLPLGERAVAVWDFGTHLVDVEVEGHRYSYYRVDRYFVEVSFERVTQLRMIDIKGFLRGTPFERMSAVVDSRGGSTEL